MKFSTIVKSFFILIMLAIIAIGVLFATHVNSVPRLDEEVKAQWSQVQNQYKRRADLMPNLIKMVKDANAYEQETLLRVTQARSAVGQIQLDDKLIDDPKAMQQYLQAQKQLSSSFSRLMAVAESYPDLKSNKNFSALQSQFEGSENRLAVARRDYINAVKAYNTELRTFPGSTVAQLLHPDAKVRETFSATEEEQKLPEYDDY